MAEPKTRMTESSVTTFIEKVDDEKRRDDCYAIIEMMRKASGHEPKMWGTAIIGFGAHKQRYATGRELEWPDIAFSPRKQNITLYLEPDLLATSALMKKLGRFKTGKGCLYVKSLDDIDTTILEKLLHASLKIKR